MQSRSRTITTQANHGGKACPAQAALLDTINCNTKACPIHCKYTFGSWGKCTKSCGNGAQKRSLSVTTRHGGCPLPRKR